MLSRFDPTPAAWTLDRPAGSWDLAIAGDFMTVAVAVTLLGFGRYGITEIGTAEPRTMPLCVLAERDDWYCDTFGAPYAEVREHVMQERRRALAAALESVGGSNTAEADKAHALAHVVRKSTPRKEIPSL